MSQLDPSSFSFSFEFQFQCACSVHIGPMSNEEATELATQACEKDAKEAELSPLARRMQQYAREQVQNRRSRNELDEDDYSLLHLEVETINNTVRAKLADGKSLQWLTRCTKRLDASHPTLYHAALSTPQRTSFWPSRPRTRHFEGMNGTPMSFEPPFTTPSDVRGIYESDADNEFNRFLHNERLLRNAVATYPEKAMQKAKNNSFNKLLRSKSEMSMKPGTSHIAREAQSVLNLFALLDQRDKEEQLLAEAMDSPIPSPTSSIKHLPRLNRSDTEGNLSAMSMAYANLDDKTEAWEVSPERFEIDDIDGPSSEDAWEDEPEGCDDEAADDDDDDDDEGLVEDNGTHELRTPDPDINAFDSDSDWIQV